jgi:hypothetical protein
MRCDNSGDQGLSPAPLPMGRGRVRGSYLNGFGFFWLQEETHALMEEGDREP